jgi:DNA-binding response OmpR family regulator
VAGTLLGGGRRVMLVDDDGVCLAMLARGLRRRGFVVSTYSDPREAMNCLVDELPDAVVTDMRMPHMTGLEVVQDVHAQLGAKAPPVLVVSADGGEQLLVEAFRLGAADYLLKPVSEVELGVKLSRAVSRKGSTLAIPQQVGEWVLGECVGRGGTAAVFKATRESEPDVTYALKVVWPHLTGNTETLLRFRREIDTLSTLEHPRLVRFVMSGRAEECFYYVMSYVDGGTLRSRIKTRGAHSVKEALDLIEQVAEPLGFMHENGLVHRDVKPGNIFYTADDVVLGDFGLTKRTLDRGITLEEEFIGTPLYLAPEVFKSAEFGPTVDFYSLGVCATEMLLGHAVVEERDSMRLIGRILNEGLPTPRELLPDAPEGVKALLERLLSHRPDERPPNAQTLVQAVQAARGTG